MSTRPKIVYDLATDVIPYFLSRPRRFGKSLLCSTFEALFKNKRTLFDGLWIARSDWKWEEYPTIHLSMTDVKKDTPQDFEEGLRQNLKMDRQ